jgi:homocysteine S-methyltransferase
MVNESPWLISDPPALNHFPVVAIRLLIPTFSSMLKQLLAGHPRILSECAVAERLRRLPGVELHPTLFNTPLIYGPASSREAMASIYREYLSVARRSGLPILLSAPTWRLDATRVAAAGVPESIVADAARFLLELRAEAPDGQGPVAVGGLVGPRSDCYRPDLAPSADEAEALTSERQQFHAELFA